MSMAPLSDGSAVCLPILNIKYLSYNNTPPLPKKIVQGIRSWPREARCLTKKSDFKNLVRLSLSQVLTFGLLFSFLQLSVSIISEMKRKHTEIHFVYGR